MSDIKKTAPDKQELEHVRVNIPLRAIHFDNCVYEAQFQEKIVAGTIEHSDLTELGYLIETAINREDIVITIL